MKKDIKKIILAIATGFTFIITGCLIGGFFGGSFFGMGLFFMVSFTIGRWQFNQVQKKVDEIQQIIFNLKNDIRDGNIN